MTQAITLNINGKHRELQVAARTHLADALREELHLTGTHLGCEQGVCGACTVMIDGHPQRSCLNLAASCVAKSVRTIEDFDDDLVMIRLRENFSRYHALQCGYCTPGMLVTAHDILRRLPNADEAVVRRELAGNLCRCTGYAGIVDAILATLREFPSDHPWRNEQEVHEPIATKPTEQISLSRGSNPTKSASTLEGNELRHEIGIDLPADKLWELLSDITVVTSSVPGLSLISTPDADPLRAQMTVALGPIKSNFEGEGRVDYDHANRSGIAHGLGKDRGQRSSAEGKLSFRVKERDRTALLETSIVYNISGPLAQFSRGALVDDLVATLLDQFAQNIQRTANSGQAVQAQSLNIVTLILATLTRWFRKVTGKRS